MHSRRLIRRSLMAPPARFSRSGGWSVLIFFFTRYCSDALSVTNSEEVTRYRNRHELRSPPRLAGVTTYDTWWVGGSALFYIPHLDGDRPGTPPALLSSGLPWGYRLSRHLADINGCALPLTRPSAMLIMSSMLSAGRTCGTTCSTFIPSHMSHPTSRQATSCVYFSHPHSI